MSENNSQYKVEFRLKQHTPMIHFQGHQKGATLQGTELKPKLDKFLILKLGKLESDKKETKKELYAKGIEIAEKKGWLIGKGEHPALDYKVHIMCRNYTFEPSEYQAVGKDGPKVKNGKPIMSTLPMFFANMGDEWKKKPKYFVFSDNVDVKIKCDLPDLLKMIKENFDHFIFSTNFGARTSKGFGSFSTSNIPKIDELDFLKTYKFTIDLNSSSFSNIYPPRVVNPSSNFQVYGKLFEILNIFSKTYRSGINFGGYYFKSLMYLYADKLGYTWDKKYFKSKFLGSNHDKIKDQLQKHNNSKVLNLDNISNAYLVRDLLGLSTEQLWFDYKFTVEHKKENGKSVNKVKRYQSPIRYKIIQQNNSSNKFDIYLFVDPINEEMFNKEFIITNGSEDIPISTPNCFNIEEFLNFCFTYSIENHPIKKKDESIVDHKSDKHHKVIETIFKELKPQAEGVQS